MDFKNLYKNNKNKLFVSAIMILAFIFGYSLPSLRANKGIAQDNNIGIKLAEQQNVKTTETSPTPTITPTAKATVKAQSANTKIDQTCPIKGKTTTKGAKTYYMPGSMYYARTKAEKCFSNESEAKKAGYTKSTR